MQSCKQISNHKENCERFLMNDMKDYILLWFEGQCGANDSLGQDCLAQEPFP